VILICSGCSDIISVAMMLRILDLTKELRMLEEYKIIHREIYKEIPPKVEYSLTELGVKFLPVLEALEEWAIEYERMLK